MIIIPDIHGRTFWKEAMEKRREGEKVIFLGDYTDPYEHEKIDLDQVVDNLREIVETQKKDPTVILLLGNHDLTYILPQHRDFRCRFDYAHKEELRNLLGEGDFKLTEKIKIGDKTFIFSHAGIHPDWASKVFFNIPIPDIADKANKLWEKRDPEFMKDLAWVSRERGGWCSEGSLVWSSLGEWLKFSRLDSELYQIFGHTQLQKDPYVTEYFADLDVRRGFRLGDEGKIEEL